MLVAQELEKLHVLHKMSQQSAIQIPQILTLPVEGMIRFTLFALANLILVSSSLTKAAVRGAIDCETANGRKPVAGITMRFLEWDLIGANDILNVTTTKPAGTYYLEGEEDEAVGLTIFFADVWFPCSGPIFDTCDTLKPRKNCNFVIEMLLVPKDKYYTEEKHKEVYDAGRFFLGMDKFSKSYMKCDD